MGSEATVERGIVRAHSHPEEFAQRVHAGTDVFAEIVRVFDELSKVPNDFERDARGPLGFVQE
jgi:hypothetical protein